jgi:hypothetical protein
MKVLFVSDHPSANDVCVNIIAKEFSKHGHEVHILKEKVSNKFLCDNPEGLFIRYMPSDFYTKISFYVRQNSKSIKGKIAFVFQRILGVRTILLLPWFPMRNPIRCLRYINAAEKYHREEKFDLVICCYNPLASLYAGKRLKKKYKIPFVSYYADSLTDNMPKHHFLSKKFMDNKGYRYEKKFFSYSDMILNLRCHEENFNDIKYNEFKYKMKIIDIPFLKDRINKKSKLNEGWNFVYTGAVRGNINALIETLALVDGVKLNLYGPSEVQIPDLDFIVKHGYVDKSVIPGVQENADALISLENKGSTFIPSKIFEYMSTGNKIIHFGYGKSDSTFPYLSKYQNALNLNVEDSAEKNVEKIKIFIAKPKESITFQDIRELLPECIPEYTYKIITDFLEI